MNESLKNSTTKELLDHGHSFAVLGLIMSLFAFSLSVTTPWILDYYAPPIPTIEEIDVKKSTGIKERVIGALVGGESEATEAKELEPKLKTKHWTDYWSLLVILVALGGIINGALGFIRKEGRQAGGAAIFIGMSAIVAQYAWLALTLIILFILIVGILSSLGVSF